MLVIPARVKVVVVMVSALALAAGLLTLTLLAKPAQAQAETVTDTDQDTTSFLTNGCTEPVFVEGTVHTVAHTTIDANGGFHTKLHFHIQGQGEGLSSGDKYVYNDTANTLINSTGPFTATVTQTIKIIPQGSGTTTDHFNARFVFHVTVNADGEITTEFLKAEDEPCT
jgi:hypothetical protein